MTQKSWAVGMRNAIPRNHLNAFQPSEKNTKPSKREEIVKNRQSEDEPH